MKINLKPIFLSKFYIKYNLLSWFCNKKQRSILKKKRFHLQNNKFTCVFSLGDRCVTSDILIKTNLRKWSGPLDWVEGLSLESRFKLLQSHFSGFLYRKNLIANKSICDQYGNMRVIDTCLGMRFSHDFPSGCIDDHYHYVYDKYQRRINRIYEKSKNQNCLIVYIETSIDEKDTLSIIKRNLPKIKETLEAKSLVFLYCHATNKDVHSFEKIPISDTINLFKLTSFFDKNYSEGSLPQNTIRRIYRSIFTILSE